MKVRLSAVLVSLLAVPAAAQQGEGDPAAGLELSSRLCSACHIVGTERSGSDVAPPFRSIAKDPDVTLAELHGWGGPGHPMLPNLVLTREQVADINAYLDSLRDGDLEPAPRAGSTKPPLPNAPPDRFGEPIKPSN